MRIKPDAAARVICSIESDELVSNVFAMIEEEHGNESLSRKKLKILEVMNFFYMNQINFA